MPYDRRPKPIGAIDFTGVSLVGTTLVFVRQRGALPNLTIDIGSAGGGYFSLNPNRRVIGSDAGAANTADDVFLGMSGAGAHNPHPSVIALGTNSLNALTSAANVLTGSIAIGGSALRLWNPSGGAGADLRSIVIGFEAAANAANALWGRNVVIGYRADYSTDVTSSTGLDNVVIGHRAHEGWIEGLDQAVVIGSLAAIGSVGAPIVSGLGGVVIIGYKAGFSLSATGGTNSTLIGAQAGASITTGISNIVIGALAGSSSFTTASNTIIIGNSSGTAAGSNNLLLGHGISGSNGSHNAIIGNSALGVSGKVRCVILGDGANGSGSLPSSDDMFLVETYSVAAGTRSLLWGDLNSASLLVGSKLDGGGNPTSRDFQTGLGILGLFAGTAPTGSNADAIYTWFENGVGAGNQKWKIRFPDGTVKNIQTN